MESECSINIYFIPTVKLPQTIFEGPVYTRCHGKWIKSQSFLKRERKLKQILDKMFKML